MPGASPSPSACHHALVTIQKLGGTIRTSDAIQAGIHSRTLYQLRDSGELMSLSRGVYRLATLGDISDPDLAIVATRVPQATLCLVSALAFHDITTQIPHAVSIALARGSETPRLDYPPLSVHRFSGASLREGVEEHRIDGIVIKVYSPEKTLADCYKFRHKLGMDVVLEALKLYKSRKKFKSGELTKYAKVCRVEKIMRPYLEAML